jgi:hypothetical protein
MQLAQPFDSIVVSADVSGLVEKQPLICLVYLITVSPAACYSVP